MRVGVLRQLASQCAISPHTHSTGLSGSGPGRTGASGPGPSGRGVSGGLGSPTIHGSGVRGTSGTIGGRWGGSRGRCRSWSPMVTVDGEGGFTTGGAGALNATNPTTNPAAAMTMAVAVSFRCRRSFSSSATDMGPSSARVWVRSDVVPAPVSCEEHGESSGDSWGSDGKRGMCGTRGPDLADLHGSSTVRRGCGSISRPMILCLAGLLTACPPGKCRWRRLLHASNGGPGMRAIPQPAQ